MKKEQIINVIWFQVNWFLIILLPNHLMGLCTIAVALLLYYNIRQTRKSPQECLFLVYITALGFIIEWLFIQFGILVYPEPRALPPFKMVLLWANFSLLFSLALKPWLNKPAILVIATALSAPLTYAAGARLGSFLSPPGPDQLLPLALIWAISIIIMRELHQITHQSERYNGKHHPEIH